MSKANAKFRCIECSSIYELNRTIYSCENCGGLLEVVHNQEVIMSKTASEWKTHFDRRHGGRPGPYGSGVWRFHEWVLPDLPRESIVTLGEGASPLVSASHLSNKWRIDLGIKQCGHSLSGSFKDLGMTVLISQVAEMRRQGTEIPAVACASTGDTSAALAAYGAAAGIRTLVLLPRGKITAAQLVQPLSHGSRVLAIDTDFDGCMKHVQRLCVEEGVYLANSKNSLRIEGQKTVAFEICQGLGWKIPDWIAIPGGNLGNVSALSKGFTMLKQAGIISKVPRILVAQSAQANPLFESYQRNFAPLQPLVAKPTQASAIRIGNPISFPKAIASLKMSNGIVQSVSEQELTEIGREADQTGLFVCPHTAVALAGVRQALNDSTIKSGESVVVIATAHGLKFTEFKTATASNTVAGANLERALLPVEVDNDFEQVRKAALD